MKSSLRSLDEEDCYVYEPRFSEELLSDDIQQFLELSDIWNVDKELVLAREKLNYDKR